MEIIPFVYFTCLTFFLWRKHRTIDVCVYISGLYAFTTFLAMLIVDLEMLNANGILFDDSDVQIRTLPTVVFCLLVTVSIVPFMLIYRNEIKTITKLRPFLVDGLSWFLIVVSLINLYLIGDSTMDILGGDLEAVRQAHYDGLATPAEIKAESMPIIFKYIYQFNISTLLCLPLFFYYLCCEKRSRVFLGLLFFASLSVPLAGIQAADRTEFILFAMMLLFCLFLFYGIMGETLKKRVKIASIPFVALGLLYVVSVSQARFSDESGQKNTSAGESVFQYAGQGFVNFCFFWENANPDFITAEREFPLVAHYLYKIDSTPDRRSERSGQHGFFISVFPTFLGELFLDLSGIGMCIWVVYYMLTGLLLIKYSHRTEFDISEILLIFLMAVVPIFGVFYYRYFHFYYSLMIMTALIIYFLSINKKAKEG